MSGGNRGILLAIGLAFAATSSAQAPQPKAEPKQEQAAREAQRTPAPPVVHRVELVNQASDPEGYQNPCEPGQDQRNSDLCAQWKAADAATNAAYYAWMQLWAAGAGMVGLIVTIILTLRAVRAAQQSVKVAQDTAKRQLRAYLCLQPVQIEEITLTGKPVGLSLTIENTGHTPANEYMIRFAWNVTDETPTSEFFDKHVGPYKSIEGQHSFGPGQVKTMPFEFDIGPEWRTAVINGTKKFYFFGELHYVDAFGEVRKTEFFYVYTLKLPNRLGQVPVRNIIT